MFNTMFHDHQPAPAHDFADFAIPSSPRRRVPRAKAAAAAIAAATGRRRVARGRGSGASGWLDQDLSNQQQGLGIYQLWLFG